MSRRRKRKSRKIAQSKTNLQRVLEVEQNTNRTVRFKETLGNGRSVEFERIAVPQRSSVRSILTEAAKYIPFLRLLLD